MAFKKGYSGNPGGRPKIEGSIREIAQQHGPAAFQRLVTLMGNANARVAITACTAILDRAYGKPTQPLETANDFNREKFVRAMVDARERVNRWRGNAPDERHDVPE